MQGASRCQWVEWRADLLGYEPHPDLARDKILWTYRTKEESYSDHQNCVQLIKALHSMALVDMQLIRDEALIRSLRHGLQRKVIVSFHGRYQGVDELKCLIQKMRFFSRARYWKIALDFSENSFRELLECLCFLNSVKEPWRQKILFVPMDVRWPAARLWSAASLAPFLFSCFQDSTALANGQPSIDTAMAIQRAVQGGDFYALLGASVKQSPSHLSHNSVFSKLLESKPQNARYLKFALEAEELCQLLNKAPHIGLKGFSVTMPHKELSFAQIKHSSDLAQKIGAVNLLEWKDSYWQGDNTDAMAFADFFKVYKLKSSSKALVLGAGGSAKAALATLIKRGLHIDIVSRDAAKALAVKKNLGHPGLNACEISSFTFDQQELWLDKLYDVIIQTTPLGMSFEDVYPFDISRLSKKALLIELVNGPSVQSKEAKNFHPTKLASYWQSLNRPLVSSQDFFIKQASYQFEAWSGQKASISHVLLDEFFHSN